MHFPTILKPETAGKTGQDLYADGMVEHDGHVGQLLKLLDQPGLAQNTIVLWTSDNGPMFMNWPDGGVSPYYREKGTNWEGAFRVPAVVRWPGANPGGYRAQRHRLTSRLVPDLLRCRDRRDTTG